VIVRIAGDDQGRSFSAISRYRNDRGGRRDRGWKPRAPGKGTCAARGSRGASLGRILAGCASGREYRRARLTARQRRDGPWRPRRRDKTPALAFRQDNRLKGLAHVFTCSRAHEPAAAPWAPDTARHELLSVCRAFELPPGRAGAAHSITSQRDDFGVNRRPAPIVRRWRSRKRDPNSACVGSKT